MIISKRLKQDTKLNNWIKEEYKELGNKLSKANKIKRYDYVYIFSASIGDFSFSASSQRQNVTDLLNYAGIDAPVINADYANRGDDTQRFLNKLPRMIEDITPLNNVLVIIHGPGNTVTADGPYPGGAETAKEGMKTIVDACHNAGADVLMANLTYRVPPASNPTAPYNEYVIEPLIKRYAPEGWNKVTEKPRLDLYNLFYEHRDKSADGVHPADSLQYFFRSYVAKSIADLYQVPKELTTSDLSGKSFVFSFNSDVEYFQGINPVIVSSEVGNSFSGVAGAASIIYPKDIDGKVYPNIQLQGWDFAAANSQGRSIGNDTTASVTNTRALSTSIYVADGDNPDDLTSTVEITGLPNGLTGTLTLNASRDSTASDRVGEYWLENYDFNMQTLDAAANPPTPISFDFTVENNKIVLKWKLQEGSIYAYLGVIKVDFD